jgi:hypothetical protein
MTPQLKDTVEALQALATALALCLGGAWTVALFTLNRRRYPRAQLKQQVACRKLDGDWQLVSVELEVKNAGEGLLCLTEAEILVQQALPPTGAVSRSIGLARAAGQRGIELIVWPCIVSRVLTWQRGGLEIEPGESHQFHYDFLVPCDIATVRVVSNLRNSSKRRSLWWSATTLQDVESPVVRRAQSAAD